MDRVHVDTLATAEILSSKLVDLEKEQAHGLHFSKSGLGSPDATSTKDGSFSKLSSVEKSESKSTKSFSKSETSSVRSDGKTDSSKSLPKLHIDDRSKLEESVKETSSLTTPESEIKRISRFSVSKVEDWEFDLSSSKGSEHTLTSILDSVESPESTVTLTPKVAEYDTDSKSSDRDHIHDISRSIEEIPSSELGPLEPSDGLYQQPEGFMSLFKEQELYKEDSEVMMKETDSEEIEEAKSVSKESEAVVKPEDIRISVTRPSPVKEAAPLPADTSYQGDASDVSPSEDETEVKAEKKSEKESLESKRRKFKMLKMSSADSEDVQSSKSSTGVAEDTGTVMQEPVIVIPPLPRTLSETRKDTKSVLSPPISSFQTPTDSRDVGIRKVVSSGSFDKYKMTQGDKQGPKGCPSLPMTPTTWSGRTTPQVSCLHVTSVKKRLNYQYIHEAKKN